MGVTLAQGPRGEVYVSDWSDTGECHSTRNTRKHTGRIYRITYLQTQLEAVDLKREATRRLVDLQASDNEWLVRHARRILQERHANGESMAPAHDRLWKLFSQHESTPKKLRMLWALRGTGGLPVAQLESLLESDREEIRQWSIRFLCESKQPSPITLTQLARLAREDASPRVRLALASAIQRLEHNVRWPIVEALCTHGEDNADPKPSFDGLVRRRATTRRRSRAVRGVSRQGSAPPGHHQRSPSSRFVIATRRRHRTACAKTE